MEVPYGYCHCGCGEKTRICSISRPINGHIKGQPFKFVFGHRNRLPFYKNPHHRPRIARMSIEQPNDPEIRHIALTQGKISVVNTYNYEELNRWNWCARRGSSGSYYALRNSRDSDGNKISILMHQEILTAVEGMIPDHISGDTLDNRQENLRMVTPKQNAWNRAYPKTNKSGFRGVKKTETSYLARIQIDGKCVTLGSFPTGEQAYEVYRNKEIEVKGEFIRGGTKKA